MKKNQCYMCQFDGKTIIPNEKLFPWKIGKMDVLLCERCLVDMKKLKKETMSVVDNYERYLKLKKPVVRLRYFGETWEFSIGSGSSLKNPKMCFIQTLDKIAFFNNGSELNDFFKLYLGNYKKCLQLPSPIKFNGMYISERTNLRPYINDQLEHTHFKPLRKQASLDLMRIDSTSIDPELDKKIASITTENTNDNLSEWSEHRHHVIRNGFMKNYNQFEKWELMIELLVKLQIDIEFDKQYETPEKSSKEKRLFSEILKYCPTLARQDIQKIVKKCAKQEIKDW